MFHLRLLGSVILQGPDGPLHDAVAHRAIVALLAILTRSAGGTVSRDKAVGILWPESTDARARGRLRTTLHTIRRALATDAILSHGDDLILNPTRVSSDVAAFEAAVADGRLEAAASLYGGPFLDGFHLNGAGEFERWSEQERNDLARTYEQTLERLADSAAARHDHQATSDWWDRLGRQRPESERIVLRAMRAAVAAGERSRALEHAARYEALMRDEFGAEPDTDIVELANSIRHDPNAGSGHRKMPFAQPSRVDRAALAGNLAAPPQREVPARAGSRTTAVSRLVVGCAITALATAAALLIRRPDGAPAPASDDARIRVHMLPLANETGDDAFEYAGRLAAAWIARDLTGLGSIEVLLEDDRALPRVAPQADLVLSGAIRRTADTLSMHVQITDGENVSVVRSVTSAAPIAHPAPVSAAITVLQDRIKGALATHVDPRLTRWAGATSAPPSLEAYQVFVQGLDNFLAYPGNRGRARSLFLHAAGSDSSFSLPLLWTLYSLQGASERDSVAHHDHLRDSLEWVLEQRRGSMTRWENTWLDALTGDLEASYHAYRQMVAMTPRSEWVFALAQKALAIDRPEETIELIRSIDPPTGWIRESPFFHYYLTNALHAIGRHEEELSEARRWLERFPYHGNARAAVSMALVGLGRVAEAATFVDSLAAREPDPARRNGFLGWFSRDLAAHGHTARAADVNRRRLRLLEQIPSASRVSYASILVRAGMAGAALPVLDELVGTDLRPDILVLHGHAALQLSDTAEARRILDRLRSIGQSELYQAELLTHLGETDAAVELLRQLPRKRLPNRLTFHWYFPALAARPELAELLRPPG